MPVVIEATSIFEIDRCAANPSGVYAWLSGQVSDGELLFPNAVCDHLELIARDDGHPAIIWIGAVRALRAKENALVHWQQYVVHTVPSLVDPDPPPTSYVDVAALGYELLQDGHETLVVTEDRIDGPRMSLTSACQHLGIDCTEVRWWLDDNDHELV
jgi:hypothetical protein